MKSVRHRWIAPFCVSLFAVLATEVAADPLEEVALDYALQCQGCHLANGRGGGDIPSLHGVGQLAGMPGGREYLARVPGVANASIDDARLALLLTWMLERWSGDVLPDDFAAYQPEEIARWRTPLSDPSSTRAALIAAP
jgi:mono/diheme cytochrome c family protein